jgi:hypothetical protein
VKNNLALKIGGFTALVSTGLLGSTTAATAANVDGCGLEPDGGNLDNNAGVCELWFEGTGTHSWSLPAGITGLYSVIVGAGGGGWSNGYSFGYTGAGGDVEYMDLTSFAANDTVAIVVGAGGANGSSVEGGDGGDSSVSVNGGTPVVADGGAGAIPAIFAWGYCDNGSAETVVGENVGAGVAGSPPSGEACSGGGPGIVPDSDPGAPAIFDGFTDELGHGGGVYTDTPHTQYIGEGGSQTVDTNGAAADDITGGVGADGAVIFRYNASESLASTGGALPTTFAALASVAIIAAGIGFRPFNRRRSRASL